MADVPFFANTPDDTHCFQAALKMMLKYFLPERDFSWQELEAMSDKKPGLSTWPQKALLSLNSLGFDVQMVEGFDAVAFINEGEKYLQAAFGQETAEWQITNGDITAERQTYKQALEAGVAITKRIPAIPEMQALIATGHLLICSLNAKRLNQQPGYVGHMVVVYDINHDMVTLHDPGLPPMAARKVSIADFNAAWAHPNDKAKNYISIQYTGAQV